MFIGKVSICSHEISILDTLNGQIKGNVALCGLNLNLSHMQRVFALTSS